MTIKSNYLRKNNEEGSLNSLSKTELVKINGGVELGFWAAVGAGLIIAAGAEIINDWEHFKKGVASAF